MSICTTVKAVLTIVRKLFSFWDQGMFCEEIIRANVDIFSNGHCGQNFKSLYVIQYRKTCALCKTLQPFPAHVSWRNFLDRIQEPLTFCHLNKHTRSYRPSKLPYTVFILLIAARIIRKRARVYSDACIIKWRLLRSCSKCAYNLMANFQRKYVGHFLSK